MRKWARGVVAATLLVIVSPICAPQLLAFPYSERIDNHRVYSERPIDSRVVDAVTKADKLARRSRLPAVTDQPIFLTQGGWRWRWLTQSGSDGPFGLSRAGFEAIVINRSDAASDRVFRTSVVGSQRSLSGTIAHEMTHGAIRRHFGLMADISYPRWLREGYCDCVAGGSTLTDAEGVALSRTNPSHPALIYWQGVKRVETELRRNGESVDRLFGIYAS